MTRDASTGEVLLNFTHHRIVKSAAWSPTGDYLLTASDDGIATLWNASTGEALRELAGHSRSWLSDSLQKAVFSPAGERVLTASWDRTAKMWNASTGEVLRHFTGHSDILSWAVFSPTGNSVLTNGFADTKLWNASSGEVLNTFEEPITA